MTGFQWGDYDRQMPLFIKYEGKSYWPALRDLLGVDTTGAAIALHGVMADEAGCGEVSYSRSRVWYDKRSCHPLLTFRRVPKAVDALAARGLIDHAKQVPGGRGRQSHFRARPALNELVRGIVGGAVLPLVAPHSPIILRDADGQPLPTPRTREFFRIERDLALINEGLLNLDVRTASGVSISSPLVRIFNLDPSRGGRFYAVGGSWQNIPGGDRAGVTIDGVETVELDFSALHPALLYAWVGVDPPADCYSSGNWPRQLLKLALLIVINAKSERSACLALADKQEVKDWSAAHDLSARSISSELVAAIQRVHRPIASAFFSDAGAGLMRKDSRIAADVLKAMTAKGIPTLPIHDSFLVPAQNEGELHAAMVAAAEKQGLKRPAIQRKGRKGGEGRETERTPLSPYVGTTHPLPVEL